MRFPQRDLTDQYISLSYQDVLQQYNNTSSLWYALDGLGNVVFGIPTASLGYTVITSDVTSSMTVLSASYSSFIQVFIVSSSFASSSISSSYALHASSADTSSYSVFAAFAESASYALFAEFSDSASLAARAISSSYSLMALTASYALNASGGGAVITSGSYWHITSSWADTASVALVAQTADFALVAGNTLFTSSYALTASFALNGGGGGTTLNTGSTYPITASYAVTASFVVGLNINTKIRSGDLIGAQFGGMPLTASVTLPTSFPGDLYSIVVTGQDPRTWTTQNKTNTGFVINSNSNVFFTGDVGWQAIYNDVDQESSLFRAGVVSGSAFTGIPETYTVVLTNPLPNPDYAVVIGSEDPRTWTYAQTTTSSFVLNSNSNVAMTGLVSWQIIV